jgi:hypothetical protein
MDARLPEADDRVRAPSDDPHAYRLAASRRVDGVDPECSERRVQRAMEYQVRLPLNPVQIGSSRGPNLLPEGKVRRPGLQAASAGPRLRALIPAACT